MSSELKIGFLGAGPANFGGAEGPWDHASRLEKLGGLAVVGIADLNTARAEKALAARRAGRKPALYEHAKVYESLSAMLELARPDAVFIGLPPGAHGTAEPPGDIELTCARAGVPMFIEKPLSSAAPEQVAPVAEALAAAAAGGLVVSVGYMFRYSRAVEKMREILAQTGGGLRAFLARYDCAYSTIASLAWWDKRQCGGPIVEQATHFVDLARYLGGEADAGSIRAVEISPAEPAGALADIPAGPEGRPIDAAVPDQHRTARATAAVWRFRSGALGSLTHGILLHGRKYDSELEVWGDGLRMVLADPYGACRLSVRYPGGEKVETLAFAEDDPYLSEDAAFIQAVRGRDASAIRSPYADAFKTFELTWAIRRAAEGHGGS